MICLHGPRPNFFYHLQWLLGLVYLLCWWVIRIQTLFIYFTTKVSTVVKLVRDWRKSRRGRLSRRKLNQLPVIKFNREQHAQVFECCAICLEDFKNGDKIRELPCKHGYHKSCIDPWLTSNRWFFCYLPRMYVLCYCFRKVCPLCKRTVLPSSDDSDVSESEDAPLLENEAGQNREGKWKCNK